MRSIKYYVASCLECKEMVLIKVSFKEFDKECCLDFKNLKLMKDFNDEEEAKNYLKLYKKDDEE
jgi:hypothetical protein